MSLYPRPFKRLMRQARREAYLFMVEILVMSLSSVAVGAMVNASSPIAWSMSSTTYHTHNLVWICIIVMFLLSVYE